jgi:hypothetical protein
MTTAYCRQVEKLKKREELEVRFSLFAEFVSLDVSEFDH